MYKPKGYWTKERVFEKAREYKTRSEFAKCSGSAYDAARKHNWLGEMTWFENGFILMWKKRKSVAQIKFFIFRCFGECVWSCDRQDTFFLFVIFILEKKWNFPYIYNKGNI